MVHSEMEMHIVSLKYPPPPGDSGNEDWYVNRVAGAFDVPVLAAIAKGTTLRRLRTYCVG